MVGVVCWIICPTPKKEVGLIVKTTQKQHKLLQLLEIKK